jgi:hypothetical protein
LISICGSETPASQKPMSARTEIRGRIKSSLLAIVGRRKWPIAAQRRLRFVLFELSGYSIYCLAQRQIRFRGPGRT